VLQEMDSLDQTNGLIHRIVRKYKLRSHDAEDVTQTVWLRLLENRERVRDSKALPGWIWTAARNEVVNLGRRTCRAKCVGDRLDNLRASDSAKVASIDAEEPKRALLAAFSELSDLQQQLVSMLLEEPQPSYLEISARLNIPVGSIGPNRGRALTLLRQSTQLTKLRERYLSSHDA
jgi:RNA polymerase sigma factor (sigma-70 family)